MTLETIYSDYLNKKLHLDLWHSDWDFKISYDRQIEKVLFKIPSNHLKHILIQIDSLELMDERYIDIFCDLWTKNIFSQVRFEGGSFIDRYTTQLEDIQHKIDPNIKESLEFWLDLELNLDIIGEELQYWFKDTCEELKDMVKLFIREGE